MACRKGRGSWTRGRRWTGGRSRCGGVDAGLRFVDLDEDGHEDVVFSNDEGSGVTLFDSTENGWSRRVSSGGRGGATIPAFAAFDRKIGTSPITGRGPTRVPSGGRTKTRTGCRTSSIAARSPTSWRARSPARSRPRPRCARSASGPASRSSWRRASRWCADPIAFDWGRRRQTVGRRDGRLSRSAPTARESPAGRVKFLEDLDGDGQYDKATVFLDGLSFPTGVMPWRKGVIVACAPDIFYAEDTDGDGKADMRGPLFTGFVEGNQQHRVNGLDCGLDGWLHGANGDSGGDIRSVKTGKAVNISGRDFRIQPDDRPTRGGDRPDPVRPHTATTGATGSATTTASSTWHSVLDDRYLRRNPQLAAPANLVSVLDADRRLYPAQPARHPVQRPRRVGQPLHLGVQPDRLSRRPVRRRLRGQPLRQRAGA